MKEEGFIALALSDGTPKSAAKVAVVVGTLLTLINQGDVLLASGVLVLWKAVLTYCVPYGVASWGAVSAKRTLRIPSQAGPARSGAAPSSS